MNDVLARAACDFEDDALRRQDITKDTENEIAIAQCCRGMLAGVVHHPHVFAQLGPQNRRVALQGLSPATVSGQKLVSLIPWCRASCRRRHEPCRVAQSMPTPGTIMLKNGRMCGMLR
jgi:hypothetical protein